MVLPLFPADEIVRVYEKINRMFPRDDIDLSRVYFISATFGSGPFQSHAGANTTRTSGQTILQSHSMQRSQEPDCGNTQDSTRFYTQYAL